MDAHAGPRIYRSSMIAKRGRVSKDNHCMHVPQTYVWTCVIHAYMFEYQKHNILMWCMHASQNRTTLMDLVHDASCAPLRSTGRDSSVHMHSKYNMLSLTALKEICPRANNKVVIY